MTIPAEEDRQALDALAGRAAKAFREASVPFDDMGLFRDELVTVKVPTTSTGFLGRKRISFTEQLVRQSIQEPYSPGWCLCRESMHRLEVHDLDRDTGERRLGPPSILATECQIWLVPEGLLWAHFVEDSQTMIAKWGGPIFGRKVNVNHESHVAESPDLAMFDYWPDLYVVSSSPTTDEWSYSMLRSRFPARFQGVTVALMARAEGLGLSL